MKMLKCFISYNRDFCNKLEQKFAAFFSEPSPVLELKKILEECVDGLPDGASILEPGGIDRPQLKKSERYQYEGLDVEERSTCYDVYDSFYVRSIEEPLPKKYDLIVSRALLEHVPDNRRAFRAMGDGLKVGGKMVHFIPCGNHPYSLLTRLVGNRLQKILIKLIKPQSQKTGYKVYFNYCSPRKIRSLLEGNSVHVLHSQSYWGASEYFKFFVPFFF